VSRANVQYRERLRCAGLSFRPDFRRLHSHAAIQPQTTESNKESPSQEGEPGRLEQPRVPGVSIFPSRVRPEVRAESGTNAILFLAPVDSASVRAIDAHRKMKKGRTGCHPSGQPTVGTDGRDSLVPLNTKHVSHAQAVSVGKPGVAGTANEYLFFGMK
jgi:hypothetical protein